MKASLKELIKHFLGFMTTETQEVTISYKNTKGKLTKCGNVVTFTTYADWQSLPAGGFRTVATIPTGWRPSDIVYVAEATKANIYIRILADGSVQTYNTNSSTTTSNGRYAATWVVA